MSKPSLNINRIIVLKEKGGDRYIRYSVENLRSIIEDRFDNEWYENISFEKITKLLAPTSKEIELVKFLTVRKIHEYEGFESVNVEDKYVTESDDDYDEEESEDEDL